jgi:thiosulfate/3-mercaptopyruvate sulfurtransferase
MTHSLKRQGTFIAFALIIVGVGLLLSANAQSRARATSAASSQFGQGELVGGMRLITPEDLVKILKAPKGEKPLILNIGPRMLYNQAHIPGAEYIGATYEPQAVEALRARVKPLPRTKFIVIYCGCCPWDHCPNIRPAYEALTEMGFKKVNALYIPNNLGADWVYKGYPTTSGQ